MRFSHFVFIAAAILLSSGNAIAATSGEDQAKLSLIAATDAEIPIRALSNNNDKRSLRSHEKEDAYETENEYDEDEEERGKTPAGIKDKLTFLNGVMSEKNKEKYQMFLVAWARANPQALGRN